MYEEDWKVILIYIKDSLREIGRSDIARNSLRDIKIKDGGHSRSRTAVIAMLEELLTEMYARSPELERRSMNFILNPNPDRSHSEISSEGSETKVDRAVKSLQCLIEYLKSIDADGEVK